MAPDPNRLVDGGGMTVEGTILKGEYGGGTVMVAYNHEPEAAAGGYRGTASEFIAAWRRVVTIFNQQGANNVEWTLQMTAYSFKVSSGDPRPVDDPLA